jgi:hypothetical protein
LSGADAQMEFMARNYNALRHKYTLHADYLEQMGFNTDKAAAAHIAIANSTPTVTTTAMNGTSFNYSKYQVLHIYIYVCVCMLVTLVPHQLNILITTGSNGTTTLSDGPAVTYTIGQEIQARKLKAGRSEWHLDNIRKGWFKAKVIKV